MKFKLWREYGALNSPKIFDAIEHGLQKLGHVSVHTDQDIDVIWSVLWSGRMKGNKLVYEQAKKQKRPVLIIEVGNLHRGKTWRLSFEHINGLGKFGNDQNLDVDRPKKLGFTLQPQKKSRKETILIACQHEQSLQWQGQPRMAQWVFDTVEKIRQFSSRQIVIRPHPRCLFNISLPNCQTNYPIKVTNTYDDFNIDYDHHCVVNHNSGPAVLAAINGIPIICHDSSLAGELSEKWENLENPILKDREEWFLKLCHTEWTVAEIEQGTPIKRLMPIVENTR